MADDARTFPGPSQTGLFSYPPKASWDDVADLDPKAWPRKVVRHSLLVPTTCFNCESACGLLAWVDRETLAVRKFEGNPEHPGSRGRNCAKGPATLNQITDPDRILYPLKRTGRRGAGGWERVSWDDALTDIAQRIRASLTQGRPNDVMYHVGRPGEDGFTERVLAAWGVDGHNSHTNICSSSGRAGYHFWMGADRPSPDHAHADVIFLISAHLESGHYFNPHAQRIMEAKARGAKVIVLDVRVSNTATHADVHLSPYPGSEAAILLCIARHLLETGRFDAAFMERWWNWREFMAAKHPGAPQTFPSFIERMKAHYDAFTFAYAAAESGCDEARIREIADIVAACGEKLSSHTWRSATAGNLGGWQVSRALFLLNAMKGAVAVPGGTYPNAWNKFVPRPIHMPPHPPTWNDLTWPEEFPLACNEMSFLLPHFLKEGRGKLDVYFSRVYNPVWTNPDGATWIEQLLDGNKIGLHVALTPTWSETAYFADYVLPVGLGSERHDVFSYETHDAQWLGFRQPVLRAARERLGQPPVTDTRQVNPGEVWEENELWIELSWKIDPEGELGIRKHFESRKTPGEKLGLDEYYGFIFENSVPGLPERAAALGLSPLDYMRRHGAFEVARGIGALHEEPVPLAELEDVRTGAMGRVYTRSPKPAGPNIVPLPTPDPDPEGRRPVGVKLEGREGTTVRGFPTPSGRLEFWSDTLESWGWPEHALPGYIKSHIHPENLRPGEMPLIPTFRLPVQIHTRSANAKWLDEIANTNPLWIHPQDAAKHGVRTGDLMRVTTEIGHFCIPAWVTESIRPGVVACSHHMGRWKIDGHEASPQVGQRTEATPERSGIPLPRSGGGRGAAGAEGGGAPGQRQAMATVTLERSPTGLKMSRRRGVEPYASADPDTSRIFWTEGGIHQNLTFPVHPDPISGMHCWHQAVRVGKAEAGDRPGDIVVDTAKAHAAYKAWMEKTRPARKVSPDGTRRPYWMLRPLKPGREVYKLE